MSSGIHDDATDELDDVDEAILAGLLADGRAGPSELADLAGVATSTATKRVRRLEERGVVRGYRPVVDYEAFGYDVKVVLQLDVRGGGVADVVAALEDSGRMTGVYEVTGARDVVAVGVFESTDAMNARIADLLAHEHVRTVTTDLVRDTACEGAPVPVEPDE